MASSNPHCSASETALTGAFHGYRPKDSAFSGSASLDETREWDVLATSRLVLATFPCLALMQSPSGNPGAQPEELRPGLGLDTHFVEGSLFSSPVG
jgi:hypothetical protein